MKAFSNALILMICVSATVSFSFIDQREPGPILPRGYYIVVAAYQPGQETYIDGYVKKLTGQGLHPGFGYEKARNFYYVYLDYYPGFDESIVQMLKTRKEGFPLAWVRTLKIGPDPANLDVVVDA